MKKPLFNPTEKGISQLMEDLKNLQFPNKAGIDNELEYEFSKPLHKMDTSLIEENVALWHEKTQKEIPDVQKPVILTPYKKVKFKPTNIATKAIIIAVVISIFCFTVQATGRAFNVDVFGELFQWVENKLVFKTLSASDLDEKILQIRSKAAESGIEKLILPHYINNLLDVEILDINKVEIPDKNKEEIQTDVSLRYKYKEAYMTIIASKMASYDLLSDITLTGKYSSAKTIELNGRKFYVINNTDQSDVLFVDELTVYQIFTNFDYDEILDVMETIY